MYGQAAHCWVMPVRTRHTLPYGLSHAGLQPDHAVLTDLDETTARSIQVKDHSQGERNQHCDQHCGDKTPLPTETTTVPEEA